MSLHRGSVPTQSTVFVPLVTRNSSLAYLRRLVLAIPRSDADRFAAVDSVQTSRKLRGTYVLILLLLVRVAKPVGLLRLQVMQRRHMYSLSSREQDRKVDIQKEGAGKHAQSVEPGSQGKGRGTPISSLCSVGRTSHTRKHVERTVDVLAFKLCALLAQVCSTLPAANASEPPHYCGVELTFMSLFPSLSR